MAFRCPKCNGRLVEVERARILRIIDPKTGVLKKGTFVDKDFGETHIECSECHKSDFTYDFNVVDGIRYYTEIIGEE